MPSHCFVPGCKSGYNKLFNERNKNVKLFQAPRDEDLREAWNTLISRADRTLKKWDYVCELHFEKHMIERDYVHIIKGEEVRIPRGKCNLIQGAIPTIFADTKFVRQKDQVIKEEKKQKKKRKMEEEEEEEESESNRKERTKERKVSSLETKVVVLEDKEEGNTDLDECLSSYPLTDGWSRNVLPDNSMLFSYCDGNPLNPVRHIKFVKGIYRPVIYVNGNDVTDSCRFLIHDNYIKNNPGVTIPMLLKAVSVTPLCKGIGFKRILESKCSNKLNADCLSEVTIVRGRLYGKYCKGYATALMPVCFKCKYWERQFEL